MNITEYNEMSNVKLSHIVLVYDDYTDAQQDINYELQQLMANRA